MEQKQDNNNSDTVSAPNNIQKQEMKDIWKKHYDFFINYLVKGNPTFWIEKEKFDGERIFMISSALIHEAVELQRETNWKWWKQPKPLDQEKIKEEIIDLWHFVIQLSMEAGMSLDDVVSVYGKKLEENVSRQINKY